LKNVFIHFSEKDIMSGAAAVCELCGRTFATEHEKEQHKQLEHEKRPFPRISILRELNNLIFKWYSYVSPNRVGSAPHTQTWAR